MMKPGDESVPPTGHREVAVTREDEMPASSIDSRRSASDREWFERIVVELLSDLYGTALRLTRNRAMRWT
jgi:hypothetical protein